MSGRRVILKIPKASGCGLPSLDPSESTLRKRTKKAPPPNRELEEDDQEEENEQEEEPEEEEELELEQEPEEEELEELEEPEKEEEEEERRRRGPLSAARVHKVFSQLLSFIASSYGTKSKNPLRPSKSPTISISSRSDMSKLGKKPQPKGSAILKLLDNITFARFERKTRTSTWSGGLRGQNPSVNLAISYSEDKVAPKSDVERRRPPARRIRQEKQGALRKRHFSCQCRNQLERLLYCARSIPVTITMAATFVGYLLKTENTLHWVTLTSTCAWDGDDETPPNHAIFSGNGNSGLASKSLLQRRAAAATSQASTATGPTIHNNFTIPDQLLNFFRPAGAPQPAPITQPYEPQLTLLPPG
ncbi:hypothetical protein B0H14DRAFT_2565028 [Mycena olivaceomarginata]|nr:hypothetical protein B0H14DRAFT_2565028 [Mycena olivaceomarginata]